MATGLKLTYNHQCVESRHSEKLYGDWYEKWKLHGVTSAPLTNTDVDCVSFEDVQLGDIVFIVTVVYTTGDSFGVSENGQKDSVYFTKDLDLAYIIKNQIEKSLSGSDIEITLNDGQKLKIYAYWNGYFEKLEEVRVDTIRVS